MIKDYLKNNVLIADGAMGTYYSQIISNNDTFPELANITNPLIIEKIHAEYIEAGAQLIRTNTFSANSIVLNKTRQEVKTILEKGYALAQKAALGNKVFIAASIGPIPEMTADGTILDKTRILDEYMFIVDTFLNVGANIFIFETFSRLDYLSEIASYIKDKAADAFILTQFVMTSEGFTRKGISLERIRDQIRKVTTIDAYGFNCGVGPTHLAKLISNLDFSQDVLSIFPNAGYPEIVNERMVYNNNPDYFASVLSNMPGLGANIIGGCCGTTPSHIKKLAEKVQLQPLKPSSVAKGERKELRAVRKTKNNFFDKLKNGQFTIAVELDPPFDINIDKIVHNAFICKEHGVDLITIADSPLARARVDSVMLAAKIKREVGIETMPHICCRDRNINALKSILLAGHIEEIRNVLAVTGDAIPNASTSEIKSVFNLNSTKLIEFITEMNKEIFVDDQFCIGGALNLNVLNKDVELSRMLAKTEKGAGFFLTQPIFDAETIAYLPKVRKSSQAKILGGIMPLVSYRNAQFINNEVPGINVPAEYIKMFDPNMTKEEAEEQGVDLAVKIACEVKSGVDGFYFITPFNRVEMIMKILHRCVG
ncbi:MAG: bifunctional homocysteine S-methyltransferase/5,10-methylenetetrahydrofolate reductase [Firmicutes bacterium]|nr:bifunctional homocysteine S-methyltransferase/5,10-methylenetetrahydrofolate reductase [Bacillota bacterium]